MAYKINLVMLKAA